VKLRTQATLAIEYIVYAIAIHGALGGEEDGRFLTR
jgi:hypothetical protein